MKQLYRWRDRHKLPTAPRIASANPKFAVFGSCFARNIERYLSLALSTDRSNPSIIHFHPLSIESEIAIACEQLDLAPHALVSSTDGKSTLFSYSHRLTATSDSIKSLEDADEHLNHQLKNYLNSSNVLIVTLGLAEIWFDANDPNIIYSHTPLSMKGIGNSTSARFLTHAEIRNSLCRIENLIKSNMSEIKNIIYTVSPIPLKHTSCSRGAYAGNTLSKSLLASAVLSGVSSADPKKRPITSYFPSYELITEATAHVEGIWQKDGRHLSADAIVAICEIFLSWMDIDLRHVSQFDVPLVNARGIIIGNDHLNHDRASLIRKFLIGKPAFKV